jgi:putative iron-regulated protein
MNRHVRLRISSILILPTLALSISACSDDSSNTSATSAPAESTTTTDAVPATVNPTTEGSTAEGPTAEEFAAVAATYGDLVYAAYSASIESATALQSAIDDFVADPNDATLEAAKQAWLIARDDYGPTEAFRFYEGPIDNAETGPEGQINAWPMDEAYVDYVEEDATAGIINNPTDFPEITVEVITAANEAGGETNISTGWHAIEFLLWGQDLNSAAPGARPVTDYTTAPNADRRGTYLKLLAQLLVDDLQSVADQWDPAGGEYRTAFLSEPSLAVQNILRGIGALSSGELAGERMAVALETKDQEDEHSCFSDNTNADVTNNARGIRMVYLADFAGIDGSSLSDLVAAVDPDLDAELRSTIEQSIALAEAFPATFETMIAAGDDDPAHQAYVDALVSIEDQGDLIAAAASALGLEISIEV